MSLNLLAAWIQSAFVRRCLLGLVVCTCAGASNVFAAPIMPSSPDYLWLFDGNDLATTGGVNGSRAGSGGPNPAGPAFTNDVPLAYAANRSLAYDGIDDRFVIPDTAGLRPNNGAWTSSFWFQSANSDQAGSMVSKRQEGGQFNQWAVIQGSIESNGGASGSKKLSILLRDSAGDNWWFRTVNDIVDGNWHQVVFTRNALGAGTMYVDGFAQALQQVSMSGVQPLNINNTQPWTLGWNNGGNFFAGKIDEVAFWNEALTAGNAEYLAQNSLLPAPLPAPEPSSLLLLAGGLLLVSQRRRKAADSLS